MTTVMMREYVEGFDAGLLEQLQLSDRRISGNGGKWNKASMEIGWDCYFIKFHNGWNALGYVDQSDYITKKGLSKSTFLKMVRIAGALTHLTREEFISLTVENADRLSQQSPVAKEDPELILFAQNSTSRELEDQLAHTAAKRDPTSEECRVTYKLRVLPAQRKVIEQGLLEWCQAHGIKDYGYGLELLIAEFKERAALVGFMHESLAKFEGLAAGSETAEELRALFVGHLDYMKEILDVCTGGRLKEEE
jgi:hypothetical protein